MTSHDSFGTFADHYGSSAKSAASTNASSDAETLYATPVEADHASPPPPTGKPYPLHGTGHRGSNARQSAKNQEDFERLCRDIGQGVSQVSEALAKGLAGAGGALGQAIGNAVDEYRANQVRAQEQAELARQQALVDARFGRISSIRTGGIVRSAFGGLLTLSFGGALIEEFFMVSSMGIPTWIVGMLFTGAFFGLSLKLLLSGISRIKAASDLGDIRRIMGSREAIPIAELARMMGQKPQQVAQSLKYMLNKGMIPEGRLDDECTTLMVTGGAYQHYLSLRESERQRRAAEQLKRAAENPAPPTGKPVAQDGMSPKVAAFLSSGNAYLRQFRQLDIDIDDEAVSQRIVAIEAVVGRILARAKEEPQVIDQLGRFVDYYLPTTVKLLSAYDALEEQSVQGENIESSRREIESTLDVLLSAYEKLLDATFADLSMDVSSEISVLNVVLAQEGLTQSPFDSSASKTP